MDCGLDSLTTLSSGYYCFSAESQYFTPNLEYYNLINFPTVYYTVPIVINYNNRNLSVYTQSESDSQYSRVYRLPDTHTTTLPGQPPGYQWVWVGSIRAVVDDAASDIRLDFTTHMGSLNPNSGQDTIMIFRFKRSIADPVLFGNGDAYYLGSYPPNPTHIRVEKSSFDENVLQTYARMGDRSNGSCVISMCKNFTFVGQIVGTLPDLINSCT